VGNRTASGAAIERRADSVQLTNDPAWPPYRWAILVVLWVTYVVVFISRLSVGPLAPFFKSELSISNAQVGLVLSAASFGYTITQIPTGWFVDRIGARWPIAVGEFVAAACMWSASRASGYIWLISFMLLAGMGCGLLMPATTQAVVVWFPRKQRATVMGVKQSAVNMGGIIGAAMLPLIAIRFGWRAGFFAVGCLAFAIGVIALMLYRSPSAVRESDTAPAMPFSALLRNRDIWLVACAGLCMNWVELAVIAHFTVYAKEALGYSAVAAGGMLAWIETAGAIARPTSGVFSDWLFHGKRRPPFLILAIAAALSCVVVAGWGEQLGGLIYVVAFVLGVGAVGFGAIFFTMLSELGGRTGAGTASAFGSTISMVGSIVGPPVFGRIIDVTHSYRIAWTSLAAVGVLAIVALAIVNEPSANEAVTVAAE